MTNAPMSMGDASNGTPACRTLLLLATIEIDDDNGSGRSKKKRDEYVCHM